MLLTLILQITGKSTGNKFWGILANTSKKNQDTPNSISGRSIGRDIKNLSFVLKTTKSKKLKLIKSNSFKTDFLIFKVKKAFIYLQKVLIKALILHHFDIKHYIQIQIDVSSYVIGKVLS